MDVCKEGDETAKPCYIIYFDILGYKDYLKDVNSDEERLLTSIKDVFKKINEFADKQNNKTIGFKTKTFSDNVVLAIDIEHTKDERRIFESLAFLMCIFQLLFLDRHNLLIRGGFVFGNIFIDESVVFGKGLIDSVELEAKSACFPRIIIDDSVRTRLGDSVWTSKYLRQDDDDRYYLDYFNALNDYSELDAWVNESTDLNSGTGYLERRVSNIKNNLESRIKDYCKYAYNIKDAKKITARENVISKHLWILNKFNEWCDCSDFHNCSVKYSPKLNGRIMKYELVV